MMVNFHFPFCARININISPKGNKPLSFLMPRAFTPGYKLTEIAQIVAHCDGGEIFRAAEGPAYTGPGRVDRLLRSLIALPVSYAVSFTSISRHLFPVHVLF